MKINNFFYIIDNISEDAKELAYEVIQLLANEGIVEVDSNA